MPAEIPESVPIDRVPVTDLPHGWRSPTPPTVLADLGSRWVDAEQTAVLAVPSAIIPQELNYLLNPRHPHFKRIQIGRPMPFAFDPRLWKRSPGPS